MLFPVAPALANFSHNAVFLGGTSGIALALAQLLSRSSTGRANIVLVGRNQFAAVDAMERMQREAPPSSKHSYSYERCDLAGGFRGVHSLADSIKDRFEGEGVSLLVMSPGYFSLEGRVENDDGVDKKMAVHLYSRMLVTKALIPLLEKAAEKDPKQSARVLTVLDSRRNDGDALNLADLGLERTYSLASYARHATAMSNVMTEQFAARHPSIAFAHAFPGTVNTNIFNHAPGLPSILKLALRPFTPLFTVSPETCADRLGKVLWQERYRTGAWRIDEHGEPIEVTSRTTEEQGRAVWEHVSGLVDRR